MNNYTEQRAVLSSLPIQNTHSVYGKPQVEQPSGKDKVEGLAKMKELSRMVFEHSVRRIKRDRQQSNFRAEYLAVVLKMVGELRFQRPSRTIRGNMSLEDVDETIEQQKQRMETIVNKTMVKKKLILEKLGYLQAIKDKNNKTSQQLKEGRQQTTNKSKWVRYLTELNSRMFQLDGNHSKLLASIQEKEWNLEQQRGEATSLAMQCFKIRQRIRKRRDEQQNSLQRQKQLQKLLSSLSSKQSSCHSEMTSCMFLVAMLCEQIYIYSLKKKYKWSEKNMPGSEANDKFDRIYRHFKERTIQIDCSKSLIYHIIIISAIYTHCKSLSLGKSIMNNYSFFSPELKPLFSYQCYQKYLSIIVEKVRMNEEWRRMREQLPRQGKEVFKQRMIIEVKEEHLSLLEKALEVFEFGNEYWIFLGKLKMQVQVRVGREEDAPQACHLRMEFLNYSA